MFERQQVFDEYYDGNNDNKGSIESNKSKPKERIFFSNLMTMEQAANYLGIRKSTLCKYTSAREITHVKVGRLVKFRREDLEGWIDERIVKPIRKD